jgi:hypothetical protein
MIHNRTADAQEDREPRRNGDTPPPANVEVLPEYQPAPCGVIGDFVRHPCTWMLLGFAGGVALTLWLTNDRKK